MVRIITDSSTLYTQAEAKELGFRAIPLCINIDDWDVRDLEVDIDAFNDKISAGFVPKSSQPPIGDVLDAFDEFPEDEIINISMADGLSGTYQSACSAKEMAENNERIEVINSTTLCGPHRYMVDCAVKMAKEGISKNEILEWLHKKIATTDSFLMPQDFSFLKRGGRLTPLAAAIGGILKLKPIVKQTEDGKRLDKFGTKRTMSSALESIAKHLEKIKLDENHILYISHANALKDAQKAQAIFSKAFPKVEIQILKLSPAFITQGGPGCLAVQYIER
ncbi:MAG: DegV family protein [Eubacteriales bacterium]